MYLPPTQWYCYLMCSDKPNTNKYALLYLYRCLKLLTILLLSRCRCLTWNVWWRGRKRHRIVSKFSVCWMTFHSWRVEWSGVTCQQPHNNIWDAHNINVISGGLNETLHHNERTKCWQGLVQSGRGEVRGYYNISRKKKKNRRYSWITTCHKFNFIFVESSFFYRFQIHASESGRIISLFVILPSQLI